MYNSLIENSLLTCFLIPAFLVYIMIYVSLFFTEIIEYFNYELQMTMFRNYSFLYLTLFIIPFILMVRNYRLEIAINSNLEERPNIFIAIYAIYLILFIAVFGVVSYRGITKVGVFLEKVPHGNIINYFVNVLNFCLTYYIITSQRKYLLILIPFSIISLYIMGALQTILFKLPPLLLARHIIKNQGIISKRLLFSLIPLIILGTLVTLWVKAFVMTGAVGGTTVVDRLLWQGELFWACINQSNKGEFFATLVPFFANFLSIANIGLVRDYGLGHFMVSLSPIVGSAYVDVGVSFAGGFPSIAIYYFGMVPAFIVFLLTAFIYLKYYAIYIDVLNRRRLGEFIVLSLLGNYVIEMFISGNIAPINLRTIIYLVIYLVIILWRAQKEIVGLELKDTKLA
jgi:hypothetical protein